MTSSLPRFLTPLGSHTSVLEALVSSSRELRQDDAGSKRTPLSDEELLAAAHELVEACVNTPDGSGLSPLSTACMYGNTETITWLLTAVSLWPVSCHTLTAPPSAARIAILWYLERTQRSCDLDHGGEDRGSRPAGRRAPSHVCGARTPTVHAPSQGEAFRRHTRACADALHRRDPHQPQAQ